MNLKFKIWDKTNKQFINNLVVGISNNELKHDRYEFLLWTGFKDKNGKEIYEGDIILETWKENRPYGYSPNDWEDNENIITIKYKAPSFNIYNKSLDYQSCIEDFQVQIIGNIYENPELLKS